MKYVLIMLIGMVAVTSAGRTIDISTRTKPLGSVNDRQAKRVVELTKEKQSLEMSIKLLKVQTSHLRKELAEVKSSKARINSSYLSIIKEQSKEIEDLKKKVQSQQYQKKKELTKIVIMVESPVTIEKGSNDDE